MDMRESKRLFVFFRVWKTSKFAQGLGFRADAGRPGGPSYQFTFRVLGCQPLHSMKLELNSMLLLPDVEDVSSFATQAPNS